MSQTWVRQAPAKINLNLRILGKRADGFHELETFMLPISLADELRFIKREEGIQMTCSDASLPCDSSNLVWKAAALFLQTYAVKGGVEIHLEKKTPHGAGLGGGSSDAATVLLTLREMYQVSTSDEELAALSSQMGSDIPFFIYRKAAWCRGRGEIIEPKELRNSYQGVLVHPGFGVPTPWAYKTYAQNPSQGVCGKDLGDVILQNDLEPPVFSKYIWMYPIAEQNIRSRSAVFALTYPGVPREELLERFRLEFGREVFSVLFESLTGSSNP
ncbi:MAG: 4-(cytidine 5'-diphospho)-2-C-methyl-D-erythritol kinase [Verrucomicrobiota bacterium]